MVYSQSIPYTTYLFKSAFELDVGVLTDHTKKKGCLI